MQLRHVNYFLAVAKYSSFTRAAAALHVSQPALSQQIKQLEDALRVQLFDRTGRTTRLTDAGEIYLGYARRALQDLDAGKRAIHDVKELSRGSLRIAITPTFTYYLVGPMIEAFHLKHPNITLSVREMSQERIEELLNKDEIDVGIAFDDVRSADIDAQTLLVESLALVVGKEHPYARKRSIGLQALNNEALVLLSREFATREQIDRYCRQHAILPRVAVEANSIGAVVEIVRRTRLSTLLPETIARQSPDLFSVTLNPSGLERTAVVLVRKGGYQSAAAKAFIELILIRARTQVQAARRK